MKKCPKCHAEFIDSAVYCDKCGTKLLTKNVCPHCGAETNDGASFCPKCGKALAAVEPPKVVQENMRVAKQDYERSKLEAEIAAYRRRKIGMIIPGSILLGLGVTLFIVFIVLLTRLDYSDQRFVKAYVFLILGVIFTQLMAVAGTALLVVQGAVYGRKISNRQRLLDEARFK